MPNTTVRIADEAVVVDEIRVAEEAENLAPLDPELQQPVQLPDIEDTLSSFTEGDSIRIKHHPVVKSEAKSLVSFTFNGKKMQGFAGEAVSTALLANNIDVFSHHPKDHSAMGIYCANGQCSQCKVMIDGVVKKSCVTPMKAGMKIKSGKVMLGDGARIPDDRDDVQDVNVLIIGGGPAGISAAIQLNELGIDTLLLDDKDRIGGKLALQTHKFFGTKQETYAGTRGFDIATILAGKLEKCEHTTVWLQATAVGVYSDGIVGVVRNHKYTLLRPKAMLVATGAREKMLVFPGNALPGVYGAGAFQTLVNRDLTRIARRVLIIGGGNVGIITAYQAVQAGIEVVAVVEAAPKYGGYKVHADRIQRMGVPILTRHTIVASNEHDSHGVIPMDDHDSESRVRSATIAELDDDWNVKWETKRTFDVDAVLVAIGLSPVDEFIAKGKEFGIPTFAAGDAKEIAEASAAMLTGRSSAVDIAQTLGVDVSGVDTSSWAEKIETLKSRPGAITVRDRPTIQPNAIRPVFHCHQEIACNSCESSCPDGCIGLKNHSLMGIPMYAVDQGFKNNCRGCLKCVGLCPGLAITLVDTRKSYTHPTVIMAHELFADSDRESAGQHVKAGDLVELMDEDGDIVFNHDDPSGNGLWPVAKTQPAPASPGTRLVRIAVPLEVSTSIASMRMPYNDRSVHISNASSVVPFEDSAIVCRCERVTVFELKEAIRRAKRFGIWDQNFIKSVTRAGMGACGSKTCRVLIPRIFASEGMSFAKVVKATERPLFVEVPLATLATAKAHPTAPSASHLAAAPVHKVDRARPTITRSSDVVILGAGAIGLGLAHALSRDPQVQSGARRVLILDVNGAPGQGDLKHAIGGVRGCMSSLAKMHVMQTSLERFRNWRNDTHDDIEWKQGGYLFVAYTEEMQAQLKLLAEVHATYNYETAYISPREVCSLVPGIQSDGLLGGLYSPQDGSCSPMLYAASAHRVAAECKGVEFKFNTPVVKLIIDDEDHIVGVLTANNERFLAPTVVNCLGAFSNAILPEKCRLPLQPDSHEAGITEPVHGGLFSPMVIDSSPDADTGTASFYFYQNSRGQVVFCATPDPPIEGWASCETSAFLPAVAERMIKLLPRLGPIHVRRTWRGLYPQTPDGNPLVGWDDHIAGLCHATGLCGHGFMMAPGLGEVVARLVLDETTEQDNEILDEFKPSRAMETCEKLK